MTNFNKNTGQFYNAVFQTVFTDRPLEDNSEVNNVIYAKALVAIGKRNIKPKEKSNNIKNNLLGR